jgi:UDPglucose--hexose-1-phosphate uridylyltransferase
MMGCSNPHPHGQVWSLSLIPMIPSVELSSLTRYASSEIPTSGAPRGPKGCPCLLCEYSHFELSVPMSEARIVIQNDHWLALVPWWATWPFEILRMSLFTQAEVGISSNSFAVLPHNRHIPSIYHLTSAEKFSFAKILSQITRRYDNLFRCSFAYSMGIHQRPIPPSENTDSDGGEDEGDVAHLHLHFYPPLLRSATIRKFLVGSVELVYLFCLGVLPMTFCL